MINDILFVLWFFLPAGVANTTPIIAAKIPFLKPFIYPVDCYLHYRGKRILGDHKTIRGFITGIIMSIVVVILQQYFYEHNELIREIVFINYNTISAVFLGFLFGIGALLGDAIESFFKRQKEISSGKAWFPFDQVDYIIGGIIFSGLYIRLDINYYFLIFIVWFFMHIFFSYIGFLLKLKTSPI